MRRNRADLDRRTLIVVMLSLLIYWVWMGVVAPAPEVEEGEGPLVEAPAVVDEPVPVPVPVAPVPAADENIPVRTLPFEMCATKGGLNTDGGGLSELALTQHQAPYAVKPLYSWAIELVTGDAPGGWSPYGDEPGPAEVFGADGRVLSPRVGAHAAPRMRVVEEGRDKMVLRGRVGDVGIEQVFTAVPANGDKPCTVDLAVTWTNQGGSPLVDGLVVSAHDSFPAGGGMMARYQSVHRPLAFADDDLVTPDVTEIETLADRSPIEGPVGWFGIGDRYFMLMAMPVEAGGTLELSGLPGGEAGLLTGFDYTALAPGLAAGASHTSNFHVYIGPLDLDVVGTISKDLTYAVDLGWFAFFAYPLLWLLKRIHSVIGDWGFSIVVLTLFVKALFFPMTQAAFKSTQAMQALNPVMTKIREDYKDQPEEMNRRIMELFKENKVNPLGGCLPMLVQFPVWIALYNVLLSSVELYHTRFLYLADLSSVDPYCVLPAVVVGLMVIQQRFAPTGNLDPAQARMMKLMPLVFGVFFFTFPSGLVVYIFVNMSLSILQQWWIKRSFGEPGAEPATT